MKSIELFAGIGGIALAAEWAGIETVAFCEREPFCQKVLNKHWPSVPIFDDIRTLNKKVLQERGVDVGAIELISGGFPCQPYSIAGKRLGKEDERHLWGEMFRVIEEVRPSWVVGENVTNFIRMELDNTLTDLESIGYACQTFHIPARGVGAPHQRYRVFIVAHAEGEQSPSETKREFGKKKQIEPRGNTLKDLSRTAWKIRKPGICGVDDGVPNRVDRLRGLGNAVVPQQIYPILHYIKQIRDMET